MVPSFVASRKYTIKRGGKTCDDFVTGSVAGRKTALIRAQLGNITNSQSRITLQASCYTKCIVTILEFLLPGPHLELAQSGNASIENDCHSGLKHTSRITMKIG
jgi:hypothetical protein